MSSLVLTALVVTLAVEVPIVALVYRREAVRMALVAAMATTATNLAMNLLLFGHVPYLVYLGVGEVGATLLEATAYRFASRERNLGLALVASAIANAASFSAGLLL